MPLTDRITADMKDALRAGDKPRLGVIRLILAAIKQREVDERIQLDDTQVLAVLDKMLKQRRESIIQFEKGARADLVVKEQAEVAIIQSYLPTQLAEAELDQLIAAAMQKAERLQCGTWARSWPCSNLRCRAAPTWAQSAPVSRRSWAADETANCMLRLGIQPRHSWPLTYYTFTQHPAHSTSP